MSGKKYRAAKEKLEQREYTLEEAVHSIHELKFAQFDETAELAVRLGVDPRHADQMVRGTVVLPNGLGKEVVVCVIASGDKVKEGEKAGAEHAGGDDLVEKIQGGWMDFDAVVATPDSEHAAVAVALGREAQAADILTALARDEAALVAAVDAMESHPKVMFILQHGGGAPMVAGTGTAADSIIRLAGGKNAVTGYRGYKPLTPESAVVLQPDAMLITDQGLKQAGGKDGLMAAPGVALTPAAQAGRIHAMDSLLLLGFQIYFYYHYQINLHEHAYHYLPDQ